MGPSWTPPTRSARTAATRRRWRAAWPPSRWGSWATWRRATAARSSSCHWGRLWRPKAATAAGSLNCYGVWSTQNWKSAATALKTSDSLMLEAKYTNWTAPRRSILQKQGISPRRESRSWWECGARRLERSFLRLDLVLTWGFDFAKISSRLCIFLTGNRTIITENSISVPMFNQSYDTFGVSLSLRHGSKWMPTTSSGEAENSSWWELGSYFLGRGYTSRRVQNIIKLNILVVCEKRRKRKQWFCKLRFG